MNGVPIKRLARVGNSTTRGVMSNQCSPPQPPLLSEREVERLREFGATRRVVVLFTRYRQPFISRLENFHKPADAALVAIFGEQFRGEIARRRSLTEIADEVMAHFDLQLWFKVW